MADLKKVKPGDRLRIPAATFNTFIDAARDFQRRRHSQAQAGHGQALPANQVYVKNLSGADRSRFDVLRIAGPIITPTQNADAFQDAVALVGDTPQNQDDGPERVVVLAGPVADGEIGRAWVSGVCQVRLDITEYGGYAAPVEDDPTHLARSQEGMPIIWHETGSGIVWALVRLDEMRVEPETTAPVGAILPYGGPINAQTFDATGLGKDGRLWQYPNMLGWALCNGNNDTPDLRGRAVFGTGNATLDEQSPGGAVIDYLTDQQSFGGPGEFTFWQIRPILPHENPPLNFMPPYVTLPWIMRVG